MGDGAAKASNELDTPIMETVLAGETQGSVPFREHNHVPTADSPARIGLKDVDQSLLAMKCNETLSPSPYDHPTPNFSEVPRLRCDSGQSPNNVTHSVPTNIARQNFQESSLRTAPQVALHRDDYFEPPVSMQTVLQRSSLLNTTNCLGPTNLSAPTATVTGVDSTIGFAHNCPHPAGIGCIHYAYVPTHALAPGGTHFTQIPARARSSKSAVLRQQSIQPSKRYRQSTLRPRGNGNSKSSSFRGSFQSLPQRDTAQHASSSLPPTHPGLYHPPSALTITTSSSPSSSTGLGGELVKMKVVE